ncbi:hypothetical protein [Campylobacter sp. MIT 97-5078]|uniref:hypothetical protein n=1 Tax=Campylobacter sp. MIT 97-5078 TaxID=1548153 RepID=UPI000513836B|nr:hypothetical protein [Campylobacter sp. MIT 97-5078]KGI55800.1 hypothetical protein LR59_10405 [Campylobacter sp. MIT 97-5078]KGI57637.1 hypothetical protein LR59_02825 [Campylobacter sp. MIT 97-5078]TQR26899.1 hypothetical protein DMB91_05830 [Campylobacter sp. MIT 97-5078]
MINIKKQKIVLRKTSVSTPLCDMTARKIKAFQSLAKCKFEFMMVCFSLPPKKVELIYTFKFKTHL